MIPLLLFLSCTTGTDPYRDPSAGNLAQNVGSAFAPCSEAEIRFLANKHNFMTAFRPCGNNHFERFAWSPDGRKLYFQLGAGHHVMDAESPNKHTRPVPTQSPVGPATWVSANRLVVPVGAPPEAAEGAGPQLALYDTDQSSVFAVDLPVDWTDIEDVQPSGDPETVLLSAIVDGERQAFRVQTSDGTAEPAFPWLSAFDTFAYTPEQGVAAVGHEGAVTVYNVEDGAPQGRWAPAKRGTVHRDGRWMMLEHDGPPQSVFYQRSWDELPPKAREREQRRAEQFAQRLPDSFETEVQPPTLSFVDLPTGRRWRVDSILGKDFSWYGPTPFYGSFLLWGFEGKQFKRNVMLGDFMSRMTVAAADGTFMGVHPFDASEGATYEPAADAPSRGADSPDGETP